MPKKSGLSHRARRPAMAARVICKMRSGLCYRAPPAKAAREIRKKRRPSPGLLGAAPAEKTLMLKKSRVGEAGEDGPRCQLTAGPAEEEERVDNRGRRDFFDDLPCDIVLSILAKISASAGSPAYLVSVLLTCKRLNRSGMHPLVLAQASAKAMAVRAKNWSESAHQFLRKCGEAGNLEALYTLGMILFYCMEERLKGMALMAKAAMGSHAAALYSISVIQFNGSGRSRSQKDLRAGAALCFRAASLGSIDALREFGHCLQDGYGVPRNVAAGRHFLFRANESEVAAALRSSPHSVVKLHSVHHGGLLTPVWYLLSGYGCNVPLPEVHAANRFMAEWFAAKGGAGEGLLRLCSYSGCGRRETWPQEFRQCSVCGAVNYCSRGCQAQHWKAAHKAECVPSEPRAAARRG